MPRDFVVDACSFKLAYDELVGAAGESLRALMAILDDNVIILDAKGQIRHEWTNVCCGADNEFLNEWLNNRIIAYQIQERPSRTNAAIRKKLREFGLPTKDQKYIFLAQTNSALGIVTEDIDFYDPREKQAGASRKKHIRLKREGRVCRYLQKEHGINVVPLERATDLI